MLVKHLIFIALIAFVVTQRPTNTIQNIIAGNYTVSINLVGGSFKILKNHQEEVNFSPQNLQEKELNGLTIANRTVDLSDKLFTVYEADYNKTHPVKYIRITSENLTPNSNLTATVFKTTITLHKNERNIYFTDAPAGSFEITHEIENWRSCHNTGANTDAPECVDTENRNLNETFIDLNLNIRHAVKNETGAVEVIQQDHSTRYNVFEYEEFTFKDSYNIQPGKSIRPEWETGYPKFELLNENSTFVQSNSSATFSSNTFGRDSKLSFRFKKPVLHKYDNNLIWCNYLYYNKKPILHEVELDANKVAARFEYNGIHLDARDKNVFYLQFTSLMIKSADGLYYLNDSNNLVGFNDKFLVLRKAEQTNYNNLKVQEAIGTMGNFLENTFITVRCLIFEQNGQIQSLNGNRRDVFAGDVRVSFEIENFPFKNEGDSLELAFSLIHPHELKVINESDNYTAKYSEGQAIVERWINNDRKSQKMDSQYPKLSFDDDRVSFMQVNLGRFNKRSEFELFLHPARKNELTPVRRFDSTNWKSDQDGNIKALADHNVECKENEVLSFWNMKSNSGKISIEYYCISFLSVESKYSWKYTNWNDINFKQDKSANFLDRHRLLCENDESIGAWRMEKSGNNIRFKYRCNKTINVSNGSRVTNWERIGEGQIQNLKEHYLFAKSKEDTLNVLRGWKMSARYVSKWCTVMCDDFQEVKFDIFFNTMRDYNDHI
jgi:hypothetical protein